MHPHLRDRRSERHARTRAEVQEAAWQLTREHGLAGWSLRDVAAAVGMRAPSLYVYFDSKNALYDALYADGYRVLIERMGAVPRTGTPSDALHRGAEAFFGFCVEEPARHQLMFLRTLPGFVPSPASYALAEQVLADTQEVLALAGAPPSSVDLWTALITGLATQQVSNDPGGDRWARQLGPAVDMFVATQLPARRRRRAAG